ncbi:hypothetical protein LSH36_148g03020 [Paralvinella palmiformis]|uniref:Uncharacterized protein n=1 Tax=Paralvinella palmiformis TaxID=53620 RepID=A0AAD9JWW3_9ANNE|nr:hypothetical protein LSH36_148g03020 [Paralvinella palmiformis]
MVRNESRQAAEFIARFYCNSPLYACITKCHNCLSPQIIIWTFGPLWSPVFRHHDFRHLFVAYKGRRPLSADPLALCGPLGVMLGKIISSLTYVVKVTVSDLTADVTPHFRSSQLFGFLPIGGDTYHASCPEATVVITTVRRHRVCFPSAPGQGGVLEVTPSSSSSARERERLQESVHLRTRTIVDRTLSTSISYSLVNRPTDRHTDRLTDRLTDQPTHPFTHSPPDPHTHAQWLE